LFCSEVNGELVAGKYTPIKSDRGGFNLTCSSC